jgi:hypothetical protein
MYQLSHMLSEQRSLLSSLTETSLLGIRATIVGPSGDDAVSPGGDESVEDAQRRKLASIIEKVEGCVVNIYYIIQMEKLKKVSFVHYI